MGELVDPRQRIGDEVLRLRHGGDLRDASASLARVDGRALVAPAVDDRAVAGLKFSAALPVELARATVGERLGDPGSTRTVVTEPRRLRVEAD